MKLLDDGRCDSFRFQYFYLAVNGRRVDCCISDYGLLLLAYPLLRIPPEVASAIPRISADRSSIS